MSDNFNITQGSGTIISTHQNVDGSHEQKVQVTSTPPVSGIISVSNLPATQPISAASLPLPAGASTEATLASILTAVSAARFFFPNTQTVTSVGVAGASVTLTLPAVVGQVHYIDRIEIIKYTTAALAGSATPVTVITTNLPGSLAYTLPNSGTVGSVHVLATALSRPLRSSVANTATTIVCPASTSTIWRVTVFYYTDI